MTISRDAVGGTDIERRSLEREHETPPAATAEVGVAAHDPTVQITENTLQPVPDSHRDELRSVAESLSGSLRVGHELRWLPAGHKPSAVRSFRRHFTELADRLDAYDRLVTEREGLRTDLHKWIWNLIEERGLNQDPYVLGGLFPDIICRRAMGPAPDMDVRLPFDDVLGYLQVHGHVAVNLSTATDVEMQKAEIDSLFFEAKGTAQYWNLAKAAQAVLMARNPLLLKVEEIRDSHVILGLGLCSLCGGPSEWREDR